MKLNISFRSLVQFALLSSYALAKKNECYEIRRYVNKKIITLFDIDECIVDKKGNVSTL